MKKLLGMGVACWAGVIVAACAGPQGPAGTTGATGPQGDAGPPGQASPSVSSVTPPYAYLGRTVDLNIAGSATTWSSATTVAFADADVKVNKVIAASPTGLLVNVTIGAGAALAATDVTVTDGSTMEVYKGAFEIRAPLAVTIDQPGGIPQGGFANLHAQMLDVSTPLDLATADIALGVADVSEVTPPTVNDFTLDTLVGADILAVAGESVDLTLTSGAGATLVSSPASAAFKVVARAPTPLTAAGASGMISTSSDSALFQLAPASAAQTFVQLTIDSPEGGGLIGLAVPKSGRLSDALGLRVFNYRFGLGTTSTDPIYLILTDSGELLYGGYGYGPPPPYDYTAAVSATACTAVAGPGASMNTSHASALGLTALPALVTNDYGDGSNAMGDWYGFAVAAGKTIHAATGGDGLSDMTLAIVKPDGTTVAAASMEDDNHKDLTAPAAAAGTYFVQVTPGAFYDPAHSTYELFVEVK